MRNLQLPGRSPVHGTNGMAATSQPLSTITAIQILEKGGNAMDAAVAAVAVQCIVEQGSTGIGGDCFCLYAPAGGDVIGFNGSGRAPAAATPEWYAKEGISEVIQHSPHAVTVPGAVDAWSQLIADHGSMELGEVLEPAIRFARDGYPVHSRCASDWANFAPSLALDANTARMLLPEGKPPEAGTIFRQPQTAETLEKIATNGPDAFYTGAVAEDMVTYLQGLGGLHTMEDFAEAKGEYVQPIKTKYDEFDIHECPPNGQGIIALEILNILSGFDLSDLHPLSVERLHIEIEAIRLAYQDRDALIADPTKAQVPTEWLLSEEHAAELRAHIAPDRVMDPLPGIDTPAHADTVYLTVVDKDRNAVSFINSLFMHFGSGLTSPNTGVIFQNRGCGFVLEAGHPNCIAPKKRPLHTIIPGMMTKNGRAEMPFGVMGGHYQAAGHARFLTNYLDFGLDIQESLDLPRIFASPEGTVALEEGVPADTAQALADMGHQIGTSVSPIGGGQAIRIDWEEGVVTGGSDPRKDGCAIGY